MREEFEKWAKSSPLKLVVDRYPSGGTWPDEYLMLETESAWQAWRACKNAQKSIELPKGYLMTDPDGLGSGRYLMIETVERAIDRAGYTFTIREN